MSMFGWMGRRPAQPTGATASETPANKRPKVDKDVARERARKNSPWRFDDGPSRRPVGKK
jgi:hypothetical protein